MTQLRSVTCHMGSHSVTCYPTQANTPRLNPSHTGRYSIYLPRRDGRLSWPSWLDGRESNLRPFDHESDAQPLHHRDNSGSGRCTQSCECNFVIIVDVREEYIIEQDADADSPTPPDSSQPLPATITVTSTDDSTATPAAPTEDEMQAFCSPPTPPVSALVSYSVTLLQYNHCNLAWIMAYWHLLSITVT